MTKSMTGFARCERRGEWGELAWELRSVNHRYLELSLRLPEEMRGLEPLVRERAGQQLGRGKVDCTLRYKPAVAGGARLVVNHELVERLVEAAAEVEALQQVSTAYSPLELLRWPGALESEAPDLTPVLAAAAELLDEVLAGLREARAREGQALAGLIQQRLEGVEAVVAGVRARLPEVLAVLRERLQARLGELREELDPARLEQELVLAAQKMDVDEELDRLAGHVTEVRRVLALDEPIGRRLDFLMQEFNREANTLGSKAADAELTRASVELKVLIEQMREQVQNIE